MQLETLDESLEEQTILKIYKNLANVFLSSNANFLPLYRDEEHEIELIPEKTPSFGPLYNLFEYQLKTLRKYIDKNLANGFIWSFKFSARALVLFSFQSDGSWWLYVDYRGLNSITIKNWYFLPLIDKILDRLSSTKVFIKINLKNTSYCLWIRESDE